MGEHYVRLGQIPSRGKTTPSREAAAAGVIEPPDPCSLRGSPLSSEPAVSSIPVDSCVKPPSLHSSRLDKLQLCPPADLLKRRSEET